MPMNSKHFSPAVLLGAGQERDYLYGGLGARDLHCRT